MKNVKLSGGNQKVGKCPNVSLIPIKDCGNCSECRDTCYAMKAWRQYPDTRKAWSHNSKLFRSDPFAAIQTVVNQLRKKRKLPFVRIHVAGDFLNQDHVEAWALCATEFPGTKFLAFTKMHELNYDVMPSNVSIVFSQWPGMPDNAPKGPRAWCQDGTETRIPDSAIHCPGSCEDCGMCWELPKLGRDVYFDIH